MFDEIFEGKLKKSDIKDIWSNYEMHESKILKYDGTNISKANILLNSIMDKEECKCLENAFFGNDGWYKRIDGTGMVRIKLAAMSLGLVNDKFTFNNEKMQQILNDISKISPQEQIAMMRCYLKQKIVTYVTLKNYNKIIRDNSNKVVLYRGINTSYVGNKYYHTSMESWTTNINTAYRFAKEGGYIIIKEYPISRIFAGQRSTFKNQEHQLYIHNGYFVRREHEMIVENSEECYDIDIKKNVILSIDKDVY